MPHIIATDQPVFWSVGNPVLYSGLTEVGGLTGTGLELNADADPNAYLGKVAGKAGSYNPLPAVGEWCEAEQIYGYNGGLVICRQSHFRTIYPPEQTLALFIVYRAGAGVLDWIPAERVEIGIHRMYGGQEYVCLQAHVTQADWTPAATLGTLWGQYVTTSEWAVGVAYRVGDIVTYQGKTYKCLQAHTSQAGWTPPVVPALWQLQ